MSKSDVNDSKQKTTTKIFYKSGNLKVLAT